MNKEGKRVATTEAEIRALIDERVKEMDSKPSKVDKTLPPWERIPGYPMTHMVWRMGSGDEARADFFDYYSSLDSEKRKVIRENFPEPDGWKGYYGLISGGAE